MVWAIFQMELMSLHNFPHQCPIQYDFPTKFYIEWMIFHNFIQYHVPYNQPTDQIQTKYFHQFIHPYILVNMGTNQSVDRIHDFHNFIHKYVSFDMTSPLNSIKHKWVSTLFFYNVLIGFSISFMYIS